VILINFSAPLTMHVTSYRTNSNSESNRSFLNRKTRLFKICSIALGIIIIDGKMVGGEANRKTKSDGNGLNWNEGYSSLYRVYRRGPTNENNADKTERQ